MPKLHAVDLVTIVQKIRGRSVVWEGVHDLLGGPVGGGVLGHVEEDNAPAMVSEHDEDEQDAQAGGGHVKKSMETRSWAWLARNVRQV